MANIHDVARRAGVSVSTVSHVVNGTRRVSDELRERVLAAIAELGYQPNRVARSLRSKKTRTLGMIIPDNTNPFFAEVARGIEDASFEHDHNLILCNSDSNRDKEIMYIEVLIAKQVDGLLLMSSGVSVEPILAARSPAIPIVIIDRDLPGAQVDCVLAANELGGWQAVRHLIDLGHQRIACIAGPSEVTPSAERVTGYRRALSDCGIPIDHGLIMRGNFDYESGYHIAQQLLRERSCPTAIFACNDLMAIGAIRAAREAGLHVPSDLSVVGYDDIGLASYVEPPLTTIRQPAYEMGVLAATMLFERIADSTLPPRRRVLGTSLVVRQSTVPNSARVRRVHSPLGCEQDGG